MCIGGLRCYFRLCVGLALCMLCSKLLCSRLVFLYWADIAWAFLLVSDEFACALTCLTSYRSALFMRHVWCCAILCFSLLGILKLHTPVFPVGALAQRPWSETVPSVFVSRPHAFAYPLGFA